MNIYVVVEGEIASKKIYQSWVPFVNPHLNYVDHISEIEHNNFSVLMGGGQPGILERIDGAIADVNNYKNVDRLVIALDSEDFTLEERYEWVYQHVSPKNCRAEIWIVIQHFCFEAWALGNVAIVSPNPKDLKLREYKNFYDVRVNDPEMLPPYPPEEINRAHFAEKYLRRAVLDSSNGQATYTKSNSNALLNRSYFDRLKRRLEQTGHISSFRGFLTAFV